MEPVPAVRRPDLLRFLPERLFRPDGVLAYVPLAWLLALIPSLGLSWLASKLVPAAGPEFPQAGAGLLLFALVVFAPVVETLIMGTILLILERLFGFLPAILLSSAGWGIAHSLQAPAWGLVIWWPFLIFSTVFLVWKRRSLWLAFLLPMLVHGLQNLGPALLVASGRA
ncbi:CPBP family intramembrane glutamic endopeptidase [Sphingomonas astaxanthinifaciens]|uniref:CAAX prenyl protease 2/Lysostaphin resistance protein A-like domain-containing protein n=1 Tax=Sphingomonas astaxanthinifaciens DSM 22298 TaxID=1123267 RepID=A0ABQ5ZCJ9_9SPHN|nr:CPBP family intramembrane glutamic endopeptidase [Sphingomonas astaxanthinifaciens]GLR48618.1 hypothetical protein GCM10007925_23360 [Sphingomonas astaxanthinifaciens DSM 22298]